MTEYIARGDAGRCPTHPGAVLREDVMPSLDMNITQVAEALGVTRQTLHRILAGEASVTPNIALRLGKFLGNGPSLWIRMQEAHDLWRARQEIAGELEAIQPAKLRYA